MTIQELQTWVGDDWRQQPDKQPSTELQLLFIMEELGEVAEAIRKSGGSKDRLQSEVDLGSEIADLIVAVTILANNFDVDMESELQRFQVRLAQRHAAGF